MKALEVPKSRPFPVIAAVTLNLIPLAGVAFWGWNAFALIFLYWLENVVIGARTLASMGANAALGGTGNAVGALVIGAFFTFHYGLFCLVHGSFVVALFGGGLEGDGMFDLISVARDLFAREPNLMLGFASIVLWQIVQLVLFIARGEAKTTNPLALMGAPYPRIIVLHVVIIFGGFLLMLLNEPMAGVLVLALVKMGFDVAEAWGKGFRFGAGAASPG